MIIIKTYEINDQTLALLPAKQLDFDTIIIEKDKKHPSKLLRKHVSTMDLHMKAGAMQWFTTRTLNSAHPFQLALKLNFTFFPTHSPNHMNNVWIAALQIAKVEELPRHEQTKDAQSIIIFKCRKTLILDVSMHTLKTQWERTLLCASMIENRLKK